MELSRTRELLPTVIWRESSPSTNAELRELAAAGSPLPHGALLATANQTAGRGRLDRGWVTPPGTAIAASLLVRGFGRSGLGASWLPLLAGSAVVAALQPFFADGRRVGVKWPNDVHVRDEDDAIAGRPGLKLCGILCEMIDADAVVVGTGINLLIPERELPTDRATSLLAAGADLGVGAGGEPSLAGEAGRGLADRVLSAYAAELLSLVELAVAHPDAARGRAARHSLTLGTEVRVHLPGGEIVHGRARALAHDGALVVDLPTGGSLAVSAGDVEHLR
ncbi:biotin--[acetyl-CoA-carboxylase] ligase [Leucobacter sp. wl10]|uniref:biotin--[acetyl-CoA-carboxylase] ligase n=1 Tax=Leucobacter sp. wl10 TaxID=2304677 RepID=UPI000E5A7BEB|nr:biotin--[acetyl-CoA-carboxylase] ligase [Leucobacter sp. wl10]RGE19840.1 biotin--[acetyl-CoA-carboxylase] ligase [Leucobacter sp. wl10]